jgi:hypothetical protein
VAKAPKRAPQPGRSRQKKHGGGSFHSENQRRFLWAVVPRAAKKWSHNRVTKKADWAGIRRPRPTVNGAKQPVKTTIHR